MCLRRIRRRQRPAALRQGLQGILKRRLRVAPLVGVHGILRHHQRVLPPLALPQTQEHQRAAHQKQCAQQRRRLAHRLFIADRPDVLFIQMPEIIQHLLRGLVTLLLVGLHRLEYDGRHRRADNVRRDRRYLKGVLGRTLAGQQVIQRRAQTVNIRPDIQQHWPSAAFGAAAVGIASARGRSCPVGGDLRLRRLRYDRCRIVHSLRAADAGIIDAVVLRRGVAPAEADPDGALLAQGQRDIEVDQLDIALRGEHHIGRLDVAVQYAVGWPRMQVLQCLQQLAGPFDHLRLRESDAPLQRFVKTLALHIIDHRIDDAVFLDEVVNLRNVGVAEIFQRVHLTAQDLRPLCQTAFIRL